MKKLDQKKEVVDMVIFDGAANVQKAGKILEVDYPLVTCVHGVEHVVSLFFSDVAKTATGRMLVKFYSLLYHWFGGTKHSLYSIFMATSQRINGEKIGLIRPAGTRMGGYWIVYTRAYPLKDVFIAMINDPTYKALKKDQLPPFEFSEVLNDAHFWDHLANFLKAMYAPLRLLRLSVTQEVHAWTSFIIFQP
jgi:hypothetical protein